MSFNFASSTMTQVPSVPTKRARHVESVLRQKFVEVVPGDAARDAGKLRPDQIAVPIANRPTAWNRSRLDATTLLHDAIQVTHRWWRPTVMTVPS